MPPRPKAAPAAAIFVDATEQAGLRFTYANGMSGEHYFNEMMGGGAALFDYDNDGDLDLYLVQGRAFESAARAAPGSRLTDRLYRNDLVSHDGEVMPRLTDVTERSGVRSQGYGMGVTAGDFDGDGWVDLYVTNFGPNVLLRNRGDGTFEDVTATAGVDDPRWSVAAAFLDFDRDGWLDLFVGNYVAFSVAAHAPCITASGAEDYCGPNAYRPEPDSLFRNRGDGSFEAVWATAKTNRDPGATLGAVATDVNADGWTDLFVANDGTPNALWINQRDGRFVDHALLAGVAVNRDGQPEASMGVDAGDFDGDGDVDLVVTHLERETNTVYANDGGGLFEDVSVASGLALPSLPVTGFGVSWLDYDNDGWLDLLSVNGAVVDQESQVRIGDPFPLRQPNQLFRNRARGRFEEVTAEAGLTRARSEVSRGAAFGDIDNDGDTDVIVVNNNGPARLFVNQVGSRKLWVGFEIGSRFRGTTGVELTLLLVDGTARVRRPKRGGSYASAGDPRVLIGLGSYEGTATVEVRWPDGSVRRWTGLEPRRYMRLPAVPPRTRSPGGSRGSRR